MSYMGLMETHRTAPEKQPLRAAMESAHCEGPCTSYTQHSLICIFITKHTKTSSPTKVPDTIPAPNLTRGKVHTAFLHAQLFWHRPDFLLLTPALTVITGVWLRAVVMVNFINGAWLAVRAVTEIKYSMLSKKE